jgi:hypothetical protein
VTAKYANHAKKEADWGSLSRIWRISRLNLFASSRRSLSGLCAPVVKIRATTPRCPVSFRQQTQFPAGAGSPPSAFAPAASTPPSRLCKTKRIPGAGWDGAGGTRGNSAKQTQFAPTRPGTGAGGRGRRRRNAQNKPNSPERTMPDKPNSGRGGLREAPPFQYSIIPPFESDAYRAKRSQSTGRFRTQLYNQSQSGVPSREEGCRCEQTKPNLGGLGYLENGVDGLVQTNPIGRDARCGLPPWACAGQLYKQTQSKEEFQV